MPTAPLTREKLLESLDHKAQAHFAASGNCAQSSFATLQSYFDLPGEDTLRALTPLPGIAMRGETCGAVTGCLMAIGMVYGRDHMDDKQGFFQSLKPAREFCRRFEEAYGHTACNKILEAELGQPFDLMDDHSYWEYINCGGFETCAEIVGTAVRIAADIILEGETGVSET